MVFQKGNTPWNKGKTSVYSKVTLEKMSKIKIGHTPWNKNTKGVVKPNRGSFRKGCAPWNKGKKMSRDFCRKNSESHKGQTPWNKGIRWREMRGENNPNYGKFGESHPCYGRHQTEEAKKKIAEAVRERRKHQKIPRFLTQPELFFMGLVEKYNLPFKYTGNGAFWVGNLNPDFIHNNGEKIAVEIFGDYWHSPLLRPNISFHQTLQGRREIFRKHGWKLIVFWESELKKPNAETLVLRRLRVD